MGDLAAQVHMDTAESWKKIRDHCDQFSTASREGLWIQQSLFLVNTRHRGHKVLDSF